MLVGVVVGDPVCLNVIVVGAGVGLLLVFELVLLLVFELVLLLVFELV